MHVESSQGPLNISCHKSEYRFTWLRSGFPYWRKEILLRASNTICTWCLPNHGKVAGFSDHWHVLLLWWLLYRHISMQRSVPSASHCLHIGLIKVLANSGNTLWMCSLEVTAGTVDSLRAPLVLALGQMETVEMMMMMKMMTPPHQVLPLSAASIQTECC